MSSAALLPYPVVVPLGGALLSLLGARFSRQAALVIGTAAMAATLGVLIAIATDVYPGGGRAMTYFFSNEHPHGGHSLGIAFTADPFGVTYALLVAALGLVLLVFVHSELGHLGKRELGAMACLIQFLLAALIAAGLTADLVNLFVWFEVAALSSYGLTGFFLERPIALEAAFKNLVLTSTAGFLVFIGAGVLYRETGALNLGQLHDVMPATPTRATLLAIAVLVSGYATKAGLMPFHGWLPDAHSPVPGAVSALFSALMVGLGIVALARVSLDVFSGLSQIRVLLTVLGVVSALAGALLALVQDDLKRLLAWDTVSQMGIIIIGLANRTADGVAGAIGHLVNHGLFKALLFLAAGAVVHATGYTSIHDLGGLARRRPVLTIAFTVASLAIAGVWPLNGYFSLGLIHSGLEDEPVVLAAAVAAQIVTVAALARATYIVFYRRRTEPYEHLERLRPGMVGAFIALALGCIALGAAAIPLFNGGLAPAAAVLLHPHHYAAAALGTATSIGSADVSVPFIDPVELLVMLAELAAGLALAVWTIRTDRVARALRWLRRVHTGVVNDYAAMAAAGIAITAVILLS